MKWLLSLALLAFGTSVMAGDMEADKSSGCGLGWNVYPDKTILGTSIRGTTHYVVPPAFGMTSGTSNCAQHDIVKADKEQMHYTASNYESLVSEMAAGQGEFLNEYAQSFGCDAAQFSQMTQSNFEKIVPTSGNSVELLNNVKNQIKTNALDCAV